MSTTQTRITCETCPAELTDADERRTGLCSPCLAAWFDEATAGLTMTIEAPSVESLLARSWLYEASKREARLDGEVSP